MSIRQLCCKFTTTNPTKPFSSGGKPRRPPISKCLLLGLSGSGKSTFLFQVKTGEFFDVGATDGFTVEEIMINRRDTITFSDLGGSSRRNIRLHFQQLPHPHVSICFFIDTFAASEDPSILDDALKELSYSVTYAQTVNGGLDYVAVVLNKQDLLPMLGTGREGNRKAIVARVREEVEDVLEMLLKELVVVAGEVGFEWEIMDGMEVGEKGISTKTGEGVGVVFERVKKGVVEGVRRSGKKLAGQVEETKGTERKRERSRVPTIVIS